MIVFVNYNVAGWVGTFTMFHLLIDAALFPIIRLISLEIIKP